MTPCVAVANELLCTWAAELTVSDSRVAATLLLWSVTFTVNEKTPAWLGMPTIAPYVVT